MSLQQITLQVTGSIVCGVGGPCMAAGDSVRLVLDKTLYPTLPDYVSGTVQQPVTAISLIDQATQLTVAGTQYIVEYETDDLNGIIPALQACDVSDLECVTCCDVLNDRVDNLAPVTAGDGISVSGGTLLTDPFVVTKLYDHKVTHITTTDTFVPGAPLPPADLSGVAVGSDKDGDMIYATYTNDFIVAWFYSGGVPTNSQVVEWPAASVTQSIQAGFTRFTYTDKLGATITWDVPNEGAGMIIGSLQAFGLIDQAISNTEEAIAFDTTESLSGCLTRSGSVFSTSAATRLNVSLRLQVDQLDVANVLTVWTKVNGVIAARSAVKIFTGVLNSNTPEVYTFSVPLAASDTVEIFAITSTVAGVNLDFTAAAGAIPTIPSASIQLEAVSL